MMVALNTSVYKYSNQHAKLYIFDILTELVLLVLAAGGIQGTMKGKTKSGTHWHPEIYIFNDIFKARFCFTTSQPTDQS